MTSPSAPQVSQERAHQRLGDIVPAVIFRISMLVAYGYERFLFNLTIDEDIIAPSDRWQRFVGSIGQGRWAMSALSLILPNPVTPGVSTRIAVTASAVAWWLFSRRVLGLSGWQSLFAATLAWTVPTLAFIFSFSTIAFAIGIGNLFLVGFIVGLRSKSWGYSRRRLRRCRNRCLRDLQPFGGRSRAGSRVAAGDVAMPRSCGPRKRLSSGFSTLIITVEGLVLNAIWETKPWEGQWKAAHL